MINEKRLYLDLIKICGSNPVVYAKDGSELRLKGIIEAQPQLKMPYTYESEYDKLINDINKLANVLLDETWCISGSCGGLQAAEIIVDEIIKKYSKPKNENKKDSLFKLLDRLIKQ